jgi:hypothetical protein
MTAELMHSLVVLGKLTFAPTDPVLPYGTYVIQRVEPGTGNVTADPTLSLQIRRHVMPVDPNTEAQQVNRNKVRLAVTAWHALGADDKARWRTIGSPRNITGFNAYLSAWLRGTLTSGSTQWDAGLSAWDAGSTRWDALSPSPWDAGATTWDGGASLWDRGSATTWDAGAAAWDDGGAVWDLPEPIAWDEGSTAWDGGAAIWST